MKVEFIFALSLTFTLFLHSHTHYEKLEEEPTCLEEIDLNVSILDENRNETQQLKKNEVTNPVDEEFEIYKSLIMQNVSLIKALINGGSMDTAMYAWREMSEYMKKSTAVKCLAQAVIINKIVQGLQI